MQIPAVIREADRTHFFPGEEAYGHKPSKTRIGDATFGVILWTREPSSDKPITLTVDVTPMSMFQGLTIEQARRMGEALIAAASEAETLLVSAMVEGAAA